MLARKNEKLIRFWQVATQPRWHVNHADTQARWHVDHLGTQAPMARDLANSFFYDILFLIMTLSLLSR